ncbi:MAG: DinB family protein [Marmoricola sp.]
MSQPIADRLDPPLRADEAETLVAFLDYHRTTFRAKVAGVGAAGLAATLGPSTMTLGGMMKHLTLVEDHWFSAVLLGNEPAAPWDSVDWEGDPDWEWRTGATDPAEQLFAAYDETVARCRENIHAVLEDGGLDAGSVKPSRQEGGSFSLRWILLHMLEEYARHNGHADLLRESVDGTVGE